MIKFILGKKLGMSQVFSEDGKVTPVTIVLAEPMRVTQLKTVEKDGYEAVQLGSGKAKKLSKPMKGHLKELGNLRDLIEWRGKVEMVIGETIDVTSFNVGDIVKVSGISKGKGFQGGVKRHGFRGMPASHGHKHVTRHVGSIGQRFPQHTLKGLRMAGRMGADRISVRGLKVVNVDKDQNLLLIKGAVPGRKGTLLEIRG
ncbi:MAG: 50S ribosomal protein L3 [bacterium]|nr:50S ribosomal protein L3 [bacterium]